MLRHVWDVRIDLFVVYLAAKGQGVDHVPPDLFDGCRSLFLGVSMVMRRFAVSVSDQASRGSIACLCRGEFALGSGEQCAASARKLPAANSKNAAQLSLEILYSAKISVMEDGNRR